MAKFVLIMLVVISPQLIYGAVVRPDNYQLTEEQKSRLRDIATEWKGAINSEKSPCEDFYDFVCTNKEHLTPERKDAVDRLKDILKENPSLVTEAEEKYLKYSTACQEFKPEDKEEFIKSFKFDNSIGNWPAFEEKWDESKFNLPLAIMEMNSFDNSVVFAHALLFDPVDVSKTYLKINKQKMVGIENYKDFFKTQFEKLGVKNPREVLSDAALFENTYNEAAESQKFPTDLMTTFSELKHLIPEVDWDKQMEITYGEKPSDNYPVIIKDHEELKEIYKGISKLSPKVIANYFFCAFVYNVNEIQSRRSLMLFVPVIKQAFMKHIYDQDTKDVLKGMYITMLEILEDENILVNFKTHYSTEQITKLINDIFVLTNDEELENEFKEVTTNSADCMKNYYLLQQIYKKETSKPFFSGRNALSAVIRILINQDLVSDIHKVIDKPSPFMFEPIMFSIMPKIIDYPTNATIYSNARECFAKQFAEAITNDDMKNMWAAQFILKAFAEWTQNYPDVVQEENKILQEYDLSAEKLLVITNMKYACGKPKFFNVAVTAFANSIEFSQTFDCPAGSKLNAATKCSFWSN